MTELPTRYSPETGFSGAFTHGELLLVVFSQLALAHVRDAAEGERLQLLQQLLLLLGRSLHDLMKPELNLWKERQQ